jgi:hypothetical protein
MDKTKNIIKTKQNGQALLFVVVAATIALTVGVAVSTRTIGSIKRSTRTDTSARIIAVAEGGMENLLSRNYTQLDEAVTPGDDGCGAIGATYDSTLNKCIYYFSGSAPSETTCVRWENDYCDQEVEATYIDCNNPSSPTLPSPKTFEYVKPSLPSVAICCPAPTYSSGNLVYDPTYAVACRNTLFQTNWYPCLKTDPSQCCVSPYTTYLSSQHPTYEAPGALCRSSTGRNVYRSCSSSNIYAQSFCLSRGYRGVSKYPYIGTKIESVVCGQHCVEYSSSVDPALNQEIGSRSIVTVERFSTNTNNNGYTFNLEPDSIREVSLVDFSGTSYGSDTMEICWDNSDALIYYYSYNQSGDVEKGGLYRNSSPYVGLEYISTFDEAVEKVGFGTCATVNLVDDHYGLRIKVLYEASKVTVYPTNSASLTDQGYRLTSKGELTQDSGNTEVATVIVYKTYPYAPSVFDYGIYTPGSLVTSE